MNSRPIELPGYHQVLTAAGFPAELLTEYGDELILPERDGTDGAYAAGLRKIAS